MKELSRRIIYIFIILVSSHLVKTDEEYYLSKDHLVDGIWDISRNNHEAFESLSLSSSNKILACIEIGTRVRCAPIVRITDSDCPSDKHGTATPVYVVSNKLHINLEAIETAITALDYMLSITRYHDQMGRIKQLNKLFHKITLEIHHAGVFVFDTLYEFNEDGYFPKPGRHYKKTFSNITRVGETSMTQCEFENWIHSVMEPLPVKDNYDILTYNCLHFVQKLCTVLGVEYPNELLPILKLIEKYRSYIDMMPSMSGRSVNYFSSTLMKYLHMLF